ncbi:putative leucine-rich repeat domain, L domain-containing protein [Rosa chinensis]|uniref:Putative leucine-rich repeat domain, L domain-containing protein n=1 Tax=Rosa chinensis TaxID=74649 RepID=A0A2P6PTN7_ROSCH|nr:putative leucine-rich repeat domain, L domain-containing protein [Rosa chinensis]
MHGMLSDRNPCENYMRIDLDADSLVGSRINMLLKRTNTLVLNMFRLRDALNLLDTECCVNLKYLELNHCHALEYVIACIVLPVLESLTIQGAEMLKEICHGEDLLPVGSRKQLSKLSLSNLPSLTNFWKIESQPEYLRNLRSVEVCSCERLKSLFQLPGASNLKELETVDIQNCRDWKRFLLA